MTLRYKTEEVRVGKMSASYLQKIFVDDDGIEYGIDSTLFDVNSLFGFLDKRNPEQVLQFARHELGLK